MVNFIPALKNNVDVKVNINKIDYVVGPTDNEDYFRAYINDVEFEILVQYFGLFC